MKNIPIQNCHDCGAKPGRYHSPGCDVERCPECGGQLLSCGCYDEMPPKKNRSPWTGVWPGHEECIEYGFFCKRGPPKHPQALLGWYICNADDPEATPDLNRLVMECIWDKKKRKWVLP